MHYMQSLSLMLSVLSVLNFILSCKLVILMVLYPYPVSFCLGIKVMFPFIRTQRILSCSSHFRCVKFVVPSTTTSRRQFSQFSYLDQHDILFTGITLKLSLVLCKVLKMENDCWPQSWVACHITNY